MIKKSRLSKKGVKAYERLSGFKTNGKVEVHVSDSNTLDLLDKLYLPK